MTDKPTVLFVCVKNGGKSQMAAALMGRAAGDTIKVESAGTNPGANINALAAQVLLEVGLDITGHIPTLLDEEHIARADLIVILGRDAHVHPDDATPVQIWDTDEPSERGIEGIERMRLVRDSISSHIAHLLASVPADDDGRFRPRRNPSPINPPAPN